MPGIHTVCPHCGLKIDEWQHPIPTVDIIIRVQGGIVLIRRKNPPYGWALPGGFVEMGETIESAAIREAKEETSLDVSLKRQFHTYSNPSRDPRHHSISTIFIAEAKGTPMAADDAADIGIFTMETLPEPIVFDHAEILNDYFEKQYRKDDGPRR